MGFLEIDVQCDTHFKDIYIAEMSSLGFDAFVENEIGFVAYIEETKYEEDLLEDIVKRYQPFTTLKYKLRKVEKKNWNEIWERNYDPIYIDDQCVVKASFHDIPTYFPYEITIDPKMSFGTGHHETTYLMLKAQLDLDFKGKHVLDVGCGTGILAIMAKMLGSAEVMACDIDEWCVENSLENFRLNECPNIKIRQGNITRIEGEFDIILANINRNVLIHDIPFYVNLLKQNGKLLMSGFYKEDIAMIKEVLVDKSMRLRKISNKHNWSCVLFEK